MLAVSALQRLTKDLAASLASMGLHAGEFGKPDLVEKPTREAEQLFQGYAKAKPSKEDAYAAARAFVRGQPLDAWQRDLVASAVAEPIREQSGAMALASKRFLALLKSYEDEAARGDLWRLTWHGLLYSYFNFDLEAGKDTATREGWEALRAFLEQTWPLMDKQAGEDLVPDWMKVLRHEVDVLTAKPVEKYSRAYLRGETESTDRVAADLGIPPSSWFWHALVLGAVRHAAREIDAEFRRLVPQLIKLIQTKPGFRDEAIEVVLNRYHGCKGAPSDERLRDFVCQPTVWKNPKLKAAGIATAWNRVPDPVWQMVLGWVNERNLKDFFDILAARNNADEGRLAFWSKYLKQISWTRLVFGADTMALKRTNAGVRELIAREEGAYAQLTRFLDFDGFMMQIGPYIIIEFSKTGKACYGYQADRLPFARYASRYAGGTEDLAAGYNQDRALRIHHSKGWEWKAEQELRQLGIIPDAVDPRRVLSSATGGTDTATNTGRTTERPESAPPGPDIARLKSLVARFRGASINDKRRTSSGGRLWVEDPLQRRQLASELKAHGFKWANSRQAWYFPER
ncbi:EH_Signature domain protein [Bordetella bronchiseptica B18-5 (C3)]|uniref:EH signature domain-containing protein n=1 Tax=Bordetella bronchiseptica TaxID=518 RepID=UPI000461E5DF|nr:EH signature domain-containing protein [Bordetella bronchiseptica]KDB58574.1 EH_Signature domain protein [Bordetella bronchiseptica B18-5 (C3)]KDD86345.1 EH_Signature domain protein [Bordetella bronchiseptica MBORD762]